jgi:hypothetical protein
MNLLGTNNWVPYLRAVTTLHGTAFMGLWSVTQAFVLGGRITPLRGGVTPLGGELDIGTHGTHRWI